MAHIPIATNRDSIDLNILARLPSLLRTWIVDIETPFEQESVELLRNLEQIGATERPTRLLKLLDDYFVEEFESTMRAYPDEEDS